MRLKHHIAYRFLKNNDLCVEMVETTFPDYDGKETSPVHNKVVSVVSLLRTLNNKTYYITNTVIEKLHLLKFKRNQQGFFDWTVFRELKPQKATFIFPDNTLLRMEVSQDFLCFCHLRVSKMYDERNGEIKWVLFYANRATGKLSENFGEQDVKQFDDFVYRLLCFMYLTDNDEVEVKPGGRHGTKEANKLVNDLQVPVTIVNSRWNTTVVMKEKFGVCGHFAIRWTGQGRATPRVVFIEPFMKNGYTIKSKSNEQ